MQQNSQLLPLVLQLMLTSIATKYISLILLLMSSPFLTSSPILISLPVLLVADTSYNIMFLVFIFLYHFVWIDSDILVDLFLSVLVIYQICIFSESPTPRSSWIDGYRVNMFLFCLLSTSTHAPSTYTPIHSFCANL